MRIRVDSVTLTYGSVKALEDVTLEVEEGRITCLLGPNGAGKTTLLRVVASVLKPKRGVVYIDGKDSRLYRPRELAKLISLSEPHISRTLPMRVVDFLLTARYPHQEPLRYFEREEDLSVVLEVSRELKIDHLLERRLDQLSSGELQRVVIATALARRPRVLLLDEPSAFLDIRYRVEALEVIRSYTLAHRTTTMVALHDLYLASLYCDTSVLLFEGRVVACGSTREVLSSPIVEEVYGVRIKTITIDGGLLFALPLPLGLEGSTAITSRGSGGAVSRSS